MDDDLAQTHPAQRTGVLVGCPHAVGGGILIARLVDDQHGLVVGEFACRPGGE